MKVCKYCGRENQNDSQLCASCGATEFERVCANCNLRCGDAAFCPNCGTRTDAEPRFCPKCATKYFTAACPSCGYISADEEEKVTDRGYVTEGPAEPNKKISFWTVLLWIFFLPIMATIAIWRSSKLKSGAKIGLTVGIWALCFLFYLAGFGNQLITRADEPHFAVAEPEDAGIPTAEEADGETYEITYKNAKAYTDSIGTVWAQAIVEITNTGAAPLYLSSAAYDLEDADGKLISSQQYISVYPDMIKPGEKAYVFDECMLDEEPASELAILPRFSTEKAKIDIVRLPVTDEKIKKGSYGSGLTLIGRVENTTGETQSMVYIVCVPYDASGTPIGLMFTILPEEIDAGARIGFECSGMTLSDDVTLDDVASHITYAYPLQFQF